MNDLTCVVQARTGSTRLPGKVLADVDGLPLLGFLLTRLAPLAGEPRIEVVVATSDAPADDAVAALAEELATPVLRGSEADVLSRFLLAVDAHPATAVVRLTGDCPLLDPDLVRAVAATHRDSGAAYTSNTLLRTFPDGLDVEVVDPTALREAAGLATDPADREHVTSYLYRHPGRYQLAQHLGDRAAGEERWTIDTAADLDWLRGAVTAVDDLRHARWTTILDALGRQGAGPGLRLEPLRFAGDAGRSERTWDVCADGDVRGTTTVVAGDDGRASVRWALDGCEPAAVRPVLAHWLAADRQVDVVDDDHGPWGVAR
ncbi:MAG: NTP transferase domain-containing protein [Acidimicrobiia bacterium]|nr:NTP transferase domain-containing protein [Acidimicrobiia bacterium]